MKTNSKPHPFCLVYGHNFVITKNLKSHFKSKIVCKTCNLNFRYNAKGDIVETCGKEKKLILHTLKKYKHNK